MVSGKIPPAELPKTLDDALTQASENHRAAQRELITKAWGKSAYVDTEKFCAEARAMRPNLEDEMRAEHARQFWKMCKPLDRSNDALPPRVHQNRNPKLVPFDKRNDA